MLCVHRRYSNYRKTLEEHNQKLNEVFERIEGLGLKVEQTKCEYPRPELEYSGYSLTKDEVKPNPSKTKAVKNFKIPTKVKKIQPFLDLSGYCRKFMKTFLV